MKWCGIILLAMMAVVASGCSYSAATGRDPLSGQPQESVKMGFWDATTFILWGIPYNRFEFELDAIGAKPQTHWVAIVTCKNINKGPAFTISLDGVETTYEGRLLKEETMAYDIPADEVKAMAAAKTITLRITHKDRHDDATLLNDQRDAIRRLWQKYGDTRVAVK